jgi:hypothetical protein
MTDTLTADALVERVARALFLDGRESDKWEAAPQWMREGWLKVARAALVAVREAAGGEQSLLSGVVGLEISAARATHPDVVGPWKVNAALLRALAEVRADV